jgi:hypothetical protein
MIGIRIGLIRDELCDKKWLVARSTLLLVDQCLKINATLKQSRMDCYSIRTTFHLTFEPDRSKDGVN